MDCAVIVVDLVAYHLEMLPEAESARIEEHLVACPDCLRTYLRVKRHVQSGAPLTEAPSEAARLRLRAAVEQEFPRARPEALDFVGWLRRPVPRYQAIAAGVLALVVAAAAPVLVQGTAPGAPGSRAAPRSDASRGHAPDERVDTARPTAASLAVY